jgi:hypothetical protein
VRLVTRWGIVGLVAAIAAGCGGSSRGQTLSDADLQRITSVRPTTPGWAWPEAPIPPPSTEPSPAQESPTPSPDPFWAALERQLSDAGGIVASGGWRWQDDAKLGTTLAWLLNSPAGAGAALAAERAFQRGWVERTLGDFTDAPIEGLGDEAWRIQSDFPGGQEVTFGWRRASLVLQVHIQCIFQSCPSDINTAGRAWVDAIDKEAVDALERASRLER